MNIMDKIRNIRNEIGYIMYKIKCFLDRIKKVGRIFLHWLLFSEVISFVTIFFISFVVILVREGIIGLSFEGIVFKLTNKGEAFLLCIPLLAGLLLELYEKKVHKVFAFCILIFFLAVNSACYPIFLLLEPEQTNLVLITALAPVIILNASAIMVIALPDASG